MRCGSNEASGTFLPILGASPIVLPLHRTIKPKFNKSRHITGRLGTKPNPAAHVLSGKFPHIKGHYVRWENTPPPFRVLLFPLCQPTFLLIQLPMCRQITYVIPAFYSQPSPNICYSEGVVHTTCGHYASTKILGILDCSQRNCRLSTSHARNCHPCRCDRVRVFLSS